MSFLDLLGTGKSIQQAQEASKQLLQQVEPIIRDVENRIGGIGESLLDRVDGATITIPEIKITLSLRPVPKAQPV